MVSSDVVPTAPPDDVVVARTGDRDDVAECLVAEDLARVAGDLYRRGWMDGTAGNVSARLPADGIALITPSGRSKGALTALDMVRVRIDSAQPVDASGPRPSAETAIHAALLRCFPASGAVAHAHPPYATTLAARAAPRGQRVGVGHVEFRDFELIKGLGVADPSRAVVPVFRNWPDVAEIARDVEAYYSARPGDRPRALLIAHHGATAWGPTPDSARDAVECLEALCHLKLLAALAAVTEEMP